MAHAASSDQVGRGLLVAGAALSLGGQPRRSMRTDPAVQVLNSTAVMITAVRGDRSPTAIRAM